MNNMMFKRNLTELIEVLSNFSRVNINYAINQLQIGAFMDSDNRPHMYLFKADKEPSMAVWKVKLEKIYNIYLENETWSKKISKFEDKYDIDFFTLVSFVYMMAPDTITDKDIYVTTSISAAILRAIEEHND